MLAFGRYWRSLLVVVILLLFGKGVSAATTYYEVRLPHGISVNLPAGWRFFNDFEQGAIEGYVDQLRDLSGFSVVGQSHKVLLMAHAMPRSNFAFVRVTFTVPGELSPSMVANLSQKDLRYLTELEMSSLVRDGGINVLEYNDFEKTVIDGHPALIGGYRREGPLGTVRVIMQFVYTDAAAIKLTASYRESEEGMWQGVIASIISSFKVKVE
ncbi:hypothetical protein [Thioalkalivibrio thiocyanodenitrificans]|uniref:hypothetical protein n=1 Tax=Thioalkalivibrio thiocyanodenitrificans TaxID=243063 RepID=UPI0012EA6BE8|nr:hypothetical protein [Thioalkalivibrio thiocyanodenitrificans]